MKKEKIAFLCIHNSCRSQIAEAFAKKYGGQIFEAYSAGTETKAKINQDAVRLMKEIYSIDMEKEQNPKLISDIPKVDRVITMGCNVLCPVLDYKYESEDWGLEDPTGKDDEEFIKIIEDIKDKVKELVLRLEKRGN